MPTPETKQKSGSMDHLAPEFDRIAMKDQAEDQPIPEVLSGFMGHVCSHLLVAAGLKQLLKQRGLLGVSKLLVTIECNDSGQVTNIEIDPEKQPNVKEDYPKWV